MQQTHGNVILWKHCMLILKAVYFTHCCTLMKAMLKLFSIVINSIMGEAKQSVQVIFKAEYSFKYYFKNPQIKCKVQEPSKKNLKCRSKRQKKQHKWVHTIV